MYKQVLSFLRILITGYSRSSGKNNKTFKAGTHLQILKDENYYGIEGETQLVSVLLVWDLFKLLGSLAFY